MISNKFREEKSYVICGRFFFTGRGMYWRSTKAGESTGGAERSGARGGLTTTRGALLGTAIGAPPEGAMQPIRRNAPIRRLIQPANHDMFAMHKCRDHRRILSKHAPRLCLCRAPLGIVAENQFTTSSVKSGCIGDG